MTLSEMIQVLTPYGISASQPTITRMAKKGHIDVINFDPTESKHYGKAFDYADQAPRQFIAAQYMKKLTTATDPQINRTRKVFASKYQNSNITSITDAYHIECDELLKSYHSPEEVLAEDDEFRFLLAYLFFWRIVEGNSSFLENLPRDWRLLKELLAFGESPILKTSKQCAVPLIAPDGEILREELTGVLERAHSLKKLLSSHSSITIEDWLAWAEVYNFFSRRDWTLDHIFHLTHSCDYTKEDIRKALLLVSAFSLPQ